jgi:hypothetical protein
MDATDAAAIIARIAAGLELLPAAAEQHMTWS